MNIEQIAKEVRLSMMQDFNGLSRDIDIDIRDETEFLRRCLSKLAEQSGVGPLGTANELIDDYVLNRTGINPCTKLYTETQYIAAQQRTAEACAKVAENSVAPAGAIIAKALRNGKWGEYL